MKVITVFDPWKSKLCSCPPKYSVSAYVGCGHKCLYCYASSYIVKFFSPRPKKNFLKELKKDVSNLPKNSYITIANSSDPYLPLEKELKLTQNTLNILKNYDIKLMLVTKSSLILRDLEILKEFKQLVVSMSITTLKRKIAKILEPSAPLPLERLKTMEKLSKYINVVCRVDPIIPYLNTGEIKKIVKNVKDAGARQIIVSTYKAKPDNFKRMIKSFPQFKDKWIKLYTIEGEKIGGYTYLPLNLRKKLIEEVKEVVYHEGLDFSSCREGLSYFNTKICDGSSFFEL